MQMHHVIKTQEPSFFSYTIQIRKCLHHMLLTYVAEIYVIII